MTFLLQGWRWYAYLPSRLSLRVEELRLLAALHRQGLFYAGLAFRIILIFCALPLIQKVWFIPFITDSLLPPTFNPWNSHLNAGDDTMAFPYGVVMYLAYLPLTTLGWLFDQVLSTGWFAKLGFGLTSLFFDYGLLVGIAILARQYSPKLLLISYWCSPLVIYILYWHGQLDILPVCLLVWGVAILQRRLTTAAGVFLGFAISAKFSMVAAFPFIAIYLYRNPRLRREIICFVSVTILTLGLTCLPFIFSESFQTMVLRTPEADRIFTVFLSYGSELRLFLLPTVYILALYLIWRLERITLDLFIISIGIGFFALLLLLPPAPGWLLWPMPFIVFYQLRSRGDYLLTIVPYFALFIAYNMLYSSGANLPWLGISAAQPMYQNLGLESSRTQSLLFTTLQAAGLLVCVRMYIYGIVRNSYYRKGRRPLIVGIAGDSGSGKDTLFASLRHLLGSESVTHISADDYYKREYSHPMWAANTHLNPRSSNLSRLTHDVFKIADGTPIWQRHYDHCTSEFTGLNKITYADVVFVTGLHSLYIRRLRQRLDLKIYLDCDERLRMYWKRQRDIHHRGHDPDRTTFEFDQRRSDSELYIHKQSSYADLIFKLSPVNPESLLTSQSEIATPRLKLFVTMASGFFHEDLIRNLIALCGMHIDVDQSSSLDFVDMCIEGDITGEDTAQIASLLIPNLEDLALGSSSWEDGLVGLVQLITLAHISDLLRSEVSSNYA